MIPKNKTISVLHPYVNKKGGAVKMMIYLSNLLKQEGNDVKLYTFNYNKQLFETPPCPPHGEREKEEVEIIIGNKISISYKIRKSDYIIIGNSPMQFVAVMSKVLFRSKAKLIWWHHHYPWYYGGNTNFLMLTKRFLEKLSIKYIDKLVANSEYLEQVLRNIYKKDVKVLYPVNSPLSAIADIPSQLRGTRKVVFTYGRWVKGKNLEQIFETYEYLKSQDLNLGNFEMRIGGEITEEETERIRNGLCHSDECQNQLNGSNTFLKKGNDNLKDSVSSTEGHNCKTPPYPPHGGRANKESDIKFLGLLDNSSIARNLQESSVFLFPSKIDSFGMAVLEAMSFGVPVVAFALNGIFEIVDNGKNGFLVKIPLKENSLCHSELVSESLTNIGKDPEINSGGQQATYNRDEFSEKVEQLLQDNKLQEIFSKNAIEKAKTFNESRFKKQLSEIFSQ